MGEDRGVNQTSGMNIVWVYNCSCLFQSLKMLSCSLSIVGIKRSYSSIWINNKLRGSLAHSS